MAGSRCAARGPPVLPGAGLHPGRGHRHDDYVESPDPAGRQVGGVDTQYRTIDGLSIRFAESEARPEDARLLSPWPESFLAFDQVWPKLAQHAYLIALDLPGYGGSERRGVGAVKVH